MDDSFYTYYDYNVTTVPYFVPQNAGLSSGNNYTWADLRTLSEASIFSISAYSVLLFFGLIGNFVVFATLLKTRYRKSSRVNRLILHLAVADLIVCCFTIPIEIGWRVTVTWDAGDSACRLLQFSRTFGLYLSSNTIICISMDRYFAIVQPLKLADARRRGRVMLVLAWLTAAISSIPQAIIFRTTSGELEELPGIIITDCISTSFWEKPMHEAVYNICSIWIMYVVPLVVTVSAYARILWEISITRRLKATSQNPQAQGEPSATTAFLTPENPSLGSPSSGTRRTYDRSVSNPNHLSVRVRHGQLLVAHNSSNRLSDLSKIERARSRTLKLTLLIVGTFIICFTPYAVVVFWYQIDQASASQLDQTIQESLFLFAVSNSIINPYLYGIYSKSLRKEMTNNFVWRAFRNCLSKNWHGGSTSSLDDGGQVTLVVGKQRATNSPCNPHIIGLLPPVEATRWTRPHNYYKSVSQNSTVDLVLLTGQNPSSRCSRTPSKLSEGGYDCVIDHDWTGCRRAQQRPPQSPVSSRKSLVSFSDKSHSDCCKSMAVRTQRGSAAAACLNTDKKFKNRNKRFADEFNSASSYD